MFDEIVAELKLQQYLTHDDRVRQEQVKASSAIRDDWQSISHEQLSFEQLTFGNMLPQSALTTEQTLDTSTSVEFLRHGQESNANKLTLHEYGDRVELHRPGGIERFTPIDGQTAKDVFINQMSELLNSGYAIRVQPPVANELREIMVMQEFLGVKLDNEGIEP